ncbi:MAG: 7TM diverse intracellular signaling domain-containing protein [Oligoflexus sp.]
MKKKLSLWTFIFLAFTVESFSQSLPVIKDGQLPAIGEHPQYLIDPDGSLGFADVMAKDLPHHEKRNPSFGWIKDIVWLSTIFQKEDEQSYIVEIGYPLLDHGQAYILHDGKLVKKLIFGDSVKNSDEILKNVNPAFYLPVDKGTYQLVLRIESSSSIQAPLSLFTESQFNKSAKEELFATGIYMGILGIMALYNFFIFVASRHRAYLYYTGFVATFLILQLSLSGHTYYYLWPSFPKLSDIMICQGGMVATIFMVLFANEYLAISQASGLRRRVIRSLLIALSSVLVLSAFIPYVTGIKMMAVSACVSVVIVLYIATYQMIGGQREARLYFVAWSVFIAACLVYILKQLGILPVNFITNYAFKIGSVIEVALLSIALADRLNTMRNALKKTNAELKDLNENLELKVVEKTHDIKTILATIPQGIFQVRIINDHPVIDQEFSEHLKVMLHGSDIAGTDPMKTVFAQSSLSSDQKAMLSAVLEGAINEELFGYEANHHGLPREMEMNGRFIEIDWSPIVDQNEIVRKILVTMKDVTDLRQYQLAAMKQAQESQTLGEIVRQDAGKMQEMIRVCEDMLETSLFHCAKFEKNSLALIYRNLHTIKGLSRNFELKMLTNSLHDAEQTIKDLQGHELSRQEIKSIEQKIRDSYQVFMEYKRINNEVLGRSDLADKVLMDRVELKDILRQIKKINSLTQLKEIESKILFMFEVKLEQVLADEVSLLGSVCKSLGKPLPQVHFMDPGVMIPPQLKNPLRKAFIHLFRNSIDHGIELAEERQKLGKDGFGHIYIDVKELDHQLIIQFWDDGRGLILNKVKDRAKILHLIENDDLSLQETIELIFAPGFSTAEKTTDISGRGVGIDAIRAFIEEAGGHVRIESAGIVGDEIVKIRFVITLPAHHEAEFQEAG